MFGYVVSGKFCIGASVISLEVFVAMYGSSLLPTSSCIRYGAHTVVASGAKSLVRHHLEVTDHLTGQLAS